MLAKIKSKLQDWYDAFDGYRMIFYCDMRSFLEEGLDTFFDQIDTKC